MLQNQNECSNDYYNIYTLHFFQTLGQLTAGLLSTAVVVPMYTYYSKYYYNNNYNNTEFYEESKQEDTEQEDTEQEGSEGEGSEDTGEDEDDLRVEHGGAFNEYVVRRQGTEEKEEDLQQLGYMNIN
jgi:hypothetical protein